MFQLTLSDSKKIDVHYKNHLISYGSDGNFPNPLEATYAALAGCAGVYSYKACKALGISADRIKIDCKPVVRAGNILLPSRFVTEVRFPECITAEQRQSILEEINRCAVKQLIHNGAGVEFVTSEAG